MLFLALLHLTKYKLTFNQSRQISATDIYQKKRQPYFMCKENLHILGMKTIYIELINSSTNLNLSQVSCTSS